MQTFLIRLLIAIGIIWLVQYVLGLFTIGEPANKIIMVAVVILMLLFLLGFFPLPL